MSQSNEFLAVTVANGENAVLNVSNVKLFKPRDHGIDGATAVLMDGSVLHLRDDFNALAVRLAFLPVPPRSRDQLSMFDERDECPSCTSGRGSGGLCGVCAAIERSQRVEAERMAVAR